MAKEDERNADAFCLKLRIRAPGAWQQAGITPGDIEKMLCPLFEEELQKLGYEFRYATALKVYVIEPSATIDVEFLFATRKEDLDGEHIGVAFLGVDSKRVEVILRVLRGRFGNWVITVIEPDSIPPPQTSTSH